MTTPSPIAASTIAAQAFRFVELGPISSFADDTEQAQAAAEQYPDAMAQCLEACDWSFASSLALLPLATRGPTDAADPDLPNLFLRPGDLIRLHDVGDDQSAWRLDMKYLRSDDVAPLRIRYTARPVNESALPATFRMAVSLALALLLAPRWLVTQSKIATLEAKFEDTLSRAMRQDSSTASMQRYDGGPMQGDWAQEAIR
jgi:hypothetical protein